MQIEAATEAGIDFVASEDVEAALLDAGLDEATTAAIVDDYEQAQLRSLKAGLLAAALIALLVPGVHQGPAELRPGSRGGVAGRWGRT